MAYNPKSQPDGKCYRSVCKKKHDRQWNTSTEAYYCWTCRLMITRYPENANLFEDHFPTRYQSKADPDVVYYVELAPGSPHFFVVVYEKKGFPGTEAHDDWFANFKDATETAKQMAEAPKPIINL